MGEEEEDEHGRGLKKRGGQCSGSWWPALTVALMMEERASNGTEMGSPPADPPGGRRGVSWKSHAPPVPPDLFTSENVLPPPVLIELVHRAGCRSRVGARFGSFDRGQTICRHGVGTRTLEHRRGIFGSPLFLAARSGRSSSTGRGRV